MLNSKLKFSCALLIALAFSLQPSAFRAVGATLPNDIRLQQFDGLQWNWIELHPTNGTTLTFDESLQFKVGAASGGEFWSTNSDTGGITNSFGTSVDTNGYLKQTRLSTGRTTTIGDGGWSLDGETGFIADSYVYNRGTNDRVFWFGVNADATGTIGPTIHFDPAHDNNVYSTFLFSSTLSNVVAASDALFAVQNALTNVMLLTGDGSLSTSATVTGTNGIASLSTTAAVTIAATGWTNTFGKNAVVYYDGTNVTAKVYNNAGTAIYTNTAAINGGGSILLQPSGAVVLSGTGVNGRAAPF